MNKIIVKNLQDLSFAYHEKYDAFALKKDPGAVADFEYENYWAILQKNIIPLMIVDSKQDKSFRIESYLPYVIDSCREKVKKEFKLYTQDYEVICKKMSLEIIKYYDANILNYKIADESKRNEFLKYFIREYSPSLIYIAESKPSIILETVAKLRTPQLQRALLKNQIIFNAIKDHVQTNLINDDWTKWLPKYFSYPRTKTIEEYFGKWVARDKIHIKICSEIFGVSYDQIKIWLKTFEKNKEKENMRNAN